MYKRKTIRRANRRLRKKFYKKWRDNFPPPCLENCKAFLKIIRFKPWNTCFVFRPGTKWEMEIKSLIENIGE